MDDANLSLVSVLKGVLKKKRVSMRHLSDKLNIPYRSLQNYMSGESRMPADVLLSITKEIGLEADYLLENGFYLTHYDMYDAVISVLGEVIPWIDIGRTGVAELRSEPSSERTHQLSVAHILAVKLSEEYGRCRQAWLNNGTPGHPRLTTEGYLEQRRKVGQLVGQSQGHKAEDGS